MEDHMITPAAHQSQDEHMTTEKQMEGKKISITTKYHK